MASASTQNPRYPATPYIVNVIGPDTVDTLTEHTSDAFDGHGTVIRTDVAGLADACLAMRALPRAGIDRDDVGLTRERQGLASFAASVNHVRGAIEANAPVHTAR